MYPCYHQMLVRFLVKLIQLNSINQYFQATPLVTGNRKITKPDHQF